MSTVSRLWPTRQSRSGAKLPDGIIRETSAADPAGPLAALMHPDRRVARFNQVHRAPLRALLAWSGAAPDNASAGPAESLAPAAAGDEDTRVWLIQGAAGQGKTRLLVEAVAAWQARQIVAGWVEPGRGVDAVEAAARLDRPVLLVVDDADRRADLPELLTAAVRASTDLRVVLAFRGPAPWWVRFRAGLATDVAAGTPVTPQTRLRPLAHTPDGYQQVFDQALRAFARTAEMAEPPAVTLTVPADQPVSTAELHAAAIAAIETGRHGVVSLETLLDHARAVEEAAWPADDTTRRTAAAVALVGAEDTPGLLGTGPMRCRPYPPGLLGERWAVEHLATDPELGAALCATDQHSRRALAEVVRISHHTRSAAAALRALLGQETNRPLRSAVLAAVDGHHSLDGVLAKTVATVSDLTPAQLIDLTATTDRLPRTHLAVRRRLLAVAETSTARAQALSGLAPLLPTGSRESREVAEEAVELFADEAGLAAAYEQLSRVRAAAGRLDEAVALAFRAVDYRQGDARDGTDLARSLQVLSDSLAGVGRAHDAVDPAERAVALLRERAGAPGPEFAAALNTLCRRLFKIGRTDEAIVVAEEAVQRSRDLAISHPDDYGPALIASLDLLSRRLAPTGQRQRALELADEAVELSRELCASRPDQFEPALGTVLTGATWRLSSVGRAADALHAAEEAVTVLRRHLDADPIRWAPWLATALNALGEHLGAAGHDADALAAAEEAIPLLRRAAATDPVTYATVLAVALSNLSRRQHRLGHTGPAVTSATEAVRTFDEAGARQSDVTYRANAASAQFHLSVVLNAVDDRAAAQAAVTEAIHRYQRLEQERPGAYTEVLGAARRFHQHITREHPADRIRLG
jgi:tetratricopeptide (TPR) repeat protein